MFPAVPDRVRDFKPGQALSGFSNSIVVMNVGFRGGGSHFRTDCQDAGGRIMKLAGKSELRLLVLTMLVTAGIGAFVSNTGTVALMLPILVSLAADGGIQTSRLLMPMAFASSMGGMLTLIGTPPTWSSTTSFRRREWRAGLFLVHPHRPHLHRDGRPAADSPEQEVPGPS